MAAATKPKLSPGAFKHVESELYRFHETHREIQRIRNEILFSSPSRDDNVGGSRGNLPGDPVGRKAILLTHRKLEQMERIVEAIRDVYDQLPDEKKKLIRLRYWVKPQTRTWAGIAQELKCGERTARYWRDQIVYAIAERIGWH